MKRMCEAKVFFTGKAAAVIFYQEKKDSERQGSYQAGNLWQYDMQGD